MSGPVESLYELAVLVNCLWGLVHLMQCNSLFKQTSIEHMTPNPLLLVKQERR